MLLARRPLTFLACIGGFALAVFIALMPLSSSGLGIEEGEIAIRTIRAPRDISFISDTLTERRQDEAADAVEDTPIFDPRSEEHTSELQSQSNLVCRLLLEKKKK